MKKYDLFTIMTAVYFAEAMGPGYAIWLGFLCFGLQIYFKLCGE